MPVLTFRALHEEPEGFVESGVTEVLPDVADEHEVGFLTGKMDVFEVFAQRVGDQWEAGAAPYQARRRAGRGKHLFFPKLETE